jgi:hypothetical protein
MTLRIRRDQLAVEGEVPGFVAGKGLSISCRTGSVTTFLNRW